MFKKSTVLGFLFLAASAFFFFFKAVSHLMERDIDMFSIEELIGLDWIYDIPVSMVRSAMFSVATAQLYVVLLILGVGCMVVSTIQKH